MWDETIFVAEMWDGGKFEAGCGIAMGSRKAGS